MAYTPVYAPNWHNLPTVDTPIDANALDTIEQGIVDAHGNAAAAQNTANTANTTANAANTAATANTAKLAHLPSINIKDAPYNALVNGTNETTLLQNATNDLFTAGGGTLVVPRGTLGVTGGGWTVNPGSAKPLVIRGEGPLNTSILRLSGSAPTLTVGAAGAANVSIPLHMYDIQVNGGASGSPVAGGQRAMQIYRGGSCYFHRTWFTSAAPSMAMFAARLWNCCFHACRFTSSGSRPAASNVAAVRLTSVLASEGGAVGDNTDTVEFSMCEWEGNDGVDLELSGDSTTASKTSVVQVIGGKMEKTVGNGAVVAATNAYNVGFGHCQLSSINGCSMSINGGQTGSSNVLSYASGAARNSVVNCPQILPVANANCLRVQDGNLFAASNHMENWPSGTYGWYVTAPGVAQSGGNFYFNPTANIRPGGNPSYPSAAAL